MTDSSDVLKYLEESARLSGLERIVTTATTRGSERWPGISVAPTALRVFIGARGNAEGPPLGELCLEDLYLACALLENNERALALFETEIMPVAGRAIARATSGAVEVDEVKQIIRHMLFVGSETRAPAISTYSGRGNLKAWMRVISVREAYRLVRKQKGQPVSGDEQLFDLLTDSESDPSVEHLKRHYRSRFKAAFATALGNLAPRQRTLLRLNVLDGLSIDEIGSMYAAHRATAARWLQKARDELLSQTRKSLAADLGVARVEVDSIIRLISSQLDVSLGGLVSAKKRAPSNRARR